MQTAAFQVWEPAAGDADWEMPGKRLSPESAQGLLDRALAALEPVPGGRGGLAGAERLLALRRQLARTLTLNSDPAEEATGRLTGLARRSSGALHEALDALGISPAIRRAVHEETRLMDRELAPPEMADAGAANRDDDPAQGDGTAPAPAYAEWVRGRRMVGEGRWAEALEALDRAASAGNGEPGGRDAISLARLPPLFALDRDEELIHEGRALVERMAAGTPPLFELGMASHWMARAEERRANWGACVEAARESNLQLFRFGASQRCRTIGENYYRVARGMAELEEWGEAAMLAQLSLRALEFDGRRPSRADALFVLAGCLRAFGGEKALADARGILTRLLEGRPSVADPEEFFRKAKRLLDEIGPGQVSAQPR